MRGNSYARRIASMSPDQLKFRDRPELHDRLLYTRFGYTQTYALREGSIEMIKDNNPAGGTLGECVARAKGMRGEFANGRFYVGMPVLGCRKSGAVGHPEAAIGSLTFVNIVSLFVAQAAQCIVDLQRWLLA
jgi:hypothetical protein